MWPRPAGEVNSAMPALRRRTFHLVTALAALALAAAATLALCLLFSYRSVAYDHRTWFHLVGAGDRLAQATRYDSWTKTIQFWKPIYPADIAEFGAKGTFEGHPTTLGPEQPPAWSAFWDDAALDRARRSGGDFGDHRHDIAVGWPWRAFTCLSDHDEQSTSPVIRGGISLPLLMVQHPNNFIGEMRAIPLRPLWRGLALDTLILWPLCAAALILSRRYIPPAIAMARDARRSAPPRSRISPPRRIVLAAAYLLLGLLTAGIVTVALPLSLYARITSTGATNRLESGLEDSLWWRQWSTQLTVEEAQDQSPAAARALIRTLRSLQYTGDQSRQLRDPGPRYATPAFLANRRIFSATETGRPFPALWGAQWVIGNGTSTTGLYVVPRWSGPMAVFTRGLHGFPTHIVWWAWTANTLFYAVVWLITIRSLVPFCRGARAAARLRRNHCPKCNYDLRATPPETPCPECGAANSRGRAPGPQ